jgi:hypothetical protein
LLFPLLLLLLLPRLPLLLAVLLLLVLESDTPAAAAAAGCVCACGRGLGWLWKPLRPPNATAATAAADLTRPNLNSPFPPSLLLPLLLLLLLPARAADGRLLHDFEGRRIRVTLVTSSSSRSATARLLLTVSLTAPVTPRGFSSSKTWACVSAAVAVTDDAQLTLLTSEGLLLACPCEACAAAAAAASSCCCCWRACRLYGMLL